MSTARRLTAQGFGADRPIADNRDFIGRAKNRRIELVIMQKLDAGALAMPRPPTLSSSARGAAREHLLAPAGAPRQARRRRRAAAPRRHLPGAADGRARGARGQRRRLALRRARRRGDAARPRSPPSCARATGSTGRPRRNLQVTVGATGALAAAARAVVDPGDEVICPTPHWPLIRGIVTNAGGVAVEAPLSQALYADPARRRRRARSSRSSRRAPPRST